MSQQLKRDELIKPYEWMAATYIFSLSVRILAKRRFKQSLILKSPLCDFICPLLVGAWIFNQQNVDRYHEYERFSLKRVEKEKTLKENALEKTESIENRKFWTNSQFWH